MQCLLLIALVALSATASDAQSIPPPVPGVCDGDGGGAVGCGFDASKLDAFGVTINPKLPVVELLWCPDKCYTPAHEWDPDCEYCQYTNPIYHNLTYRVPQNVIVEPMSMAGGCFEQKTSSQVDDYEQSINSYAGGGGWFSSWSRTTTQFYGMYYRTDSSLSLQSKSLMWHSMIIPSLPAPKPTFLFTESLSLLPDTYNYTAYKGFLDSYGTHYMNSAQVGGMALCTVYFHSCFLEQFGGKYVYSQSSSSFLGLFNHGSKNDYGYNHTDAKFKEWSNITVKMLGGDADKYGTLNWTHFITSEQAQEWEDSIKFNMMPVTYSLVPITTLISDPIKAANMQKAFIQYGAVVKDYNINLIKELEPQDPYKVPSWCHFSPHPPHAFAESKTDPEPLGASLPGCPPLPSTEDVPLERRAAIERIMQAKTAAADPASLRYSATSPLESA